MAKTDATYTPEQPLKIVISDPAKLAEIKKAINNAAKAEPDDEKINAVDAYYAK